MKHGFVICIAALAMLSVFVVHAADDQTGAEGKSSLCAACHGVAGISDSPLVPNLAGQKEEYLVKALRDYRTGKRQEPIMMSIAQDLGDDDIAELAAYFARLKPPGE